MVTGVSLSGQCFVGMSLVKDGLYMFVLSRLD